MSESCSKPRYGFYDRLNAQFPSQIIVDATEVCNFACIHCPHPDFKKSEHYKARSLDLDLHHKMVEEVRTAGKGITQYIRYTSNGEPLLHKDIYSMLDDSVQNSGVYVTLTTNGSILNETRVEKLLASGLNLIDISIDALTPETYSKIRVNGRLEVTQANVLRLIAIKNKVKARTRIVVSFVEQPQNQTEIAGFEKFWLDQGVDRVIIRRLHSAAGNVKAIAEEISKGQVSENRYPCLYPWERILLNPRGELAFCPQDWLHGSVIRDYSKTTIRETWQGEFYSRLREAHLKNNFCGFNFCAQCPDWQQTRWPGHGLSYADMVQDFTRKDTEEPSFPLPTTPSPP
jgi:MoaA/NifB/PqqE/SkfB family radical SAM enzyme